MFPMMEKEDQREDEILVECYDDGPIQFYRGPTMGINCTC